MQLSARIGCAPLWLSVGILFKLRVPREEGREGRGQVHRELGLPGAGRHRGQVCGWLSGIAAIKKEERILLPSRTFRGYIIGSL